MGFHVGKKLPFLMDPVGVSGSTIFPKSSVASPKGEAFDPTTSFTAAFVFAAVFFG